MSSSQSSTREKVTVGDGNDLYRRDSAQPTLPNTHRRFANPAPLGMFGFATSLMLISFFGVGARGATTPNIIVGPLIFFGGIGQYISGIMEFVSGNTFGYSLFLTFGSFQVSYGMIFVPGTGILAAYTDAKTGQPVTEYAQALALYIWPWFIMTVIFTVAAMRSSWVLLAALVSVDLELLLLACGLMLGNEHVQLASRYAGFVSAFFVYWAACAGLWGGGVTCFDVPVGDLRGP